LKDKALPALFDDPAHPLAAPLAAWAAASPRFAAFVSEHRDKIRKKARGAREPEAMGDLLLELAVARDLHRERYGTLGYERHLPDRTRVPDFALTLPSGAIVIIEVTRLRPLVTAPGGEQDAAAPRRASEPSPIDLRLAALVCGKLGQLVPNLPNVIIAGVPADLLPALDVAEALRALLARAERRELTPREQHYIRKPSDFFRGYRALSGLLVRPWPPPAPAGSATLWINSQAPKVLPTRLRTSLADVPAEEPAGP
jgi:hypothetical protein